MSGRALLPCSGPARLPVSITRTLSATWSAVPNVSSTNRDSPVIPRITSPFAPRPRPTLSSFSTRRIPPPPCTNLMSARLSGFFSSQRIARFIRALLQSRSFGRVQACLTSSTVADPPDFRKYARNSIRSLAASLLAMSCHPCNCVCPDATSPQQVTLSMNLFLRQY